MTSLPDIAIDTAVSMHTAEQEPVSWQTIYFVFIALAACTATQPCGRNLGIPKRYTPYLRVSPFVCVVDATWIILYPLIGSVCCGNTVREMVQDMLSRRFDGDKDVALRSSSTTSFATFRWLWFVLSGLLPLIKLFAMRGVPGCQALGLMFAISFVVTEILLVHEQWTRMKRPDLESLDLDDRNSYCLFILMALTIFVSGVSLWKESVTILDAIILGPQHGNSSGQSQSWLRFGNSISSFSILLLILFLPLQIWSSVYSGTRFSFNMDIFLSFILVISTFCGISVILNEPQESFLPSKWYFLLLCPFWQVSGTLIIIVQCAKHVWARMRWSPHREPKLSRDIESTLAMLWMLYHVLGSLLWLRFVFDGKGTGVPRWTEVFG